MREFVMLPAAVMAVVGLLSAGGCGAEAPQMLDADFATGEALGCAHVFVYRLSPDNSWGISVFIDAVDARLSQEAQEFRLGQLSDDGPRVYVELLQFNARPFWFYCDDMMPDMTRLEGRWEGIAGTVTCSISRGPISQRHIDLSYTTTLILEDAVFESPDSDTVWYLRRVDFKDVEVGYLPG